jgi:quercetin dioxygenase-like cupin family protein
MSSGERYFVQDTTTQQQGEGKWTTWRDLDPLQVVPGLNFQPVLGENVMVNFVRFEPNTVAPLHWHDEEQISFVIEGEFEFQVGDETRILRPGEAVVIPPNVPHGARTHDKTCLEVDVFHPPRKSLLEAMGLVYPNE